MKDKRLDLEALKNVSGGTIDEAFEYLDELIIKYGLEPEDYETLDKLMTQEELDKCTELILKK